jgi:hypothetical protein
LLLLLLWLIFVDQLRAFQDPEGPPKIPDELQFVELSLPLPRWGTCDLLRDDWAAVLRTWLGPPYHNGQMVQWFCSSRHGNSLNLLRRQSRPRSHYFLPACLVLIRDQTGAVFGGFCPLRWKPSISSTSAGALHITSKASLPSASGSSGSGHGHGHGESGSAGEGGEKSAVAGRQDAVSLDFHGATEESDGEFFGTPEAFVFQFSPRMEVYRYTGKGQHFMYSSEPLIGMVCIPNTQ